MAKCDFLTAADILVAYSYDPDTGLFTRHDWRARCAHVLPHGRMMTIGYRVLCIQDCLVYAHRAAFRVMTGEWPKYNIDHIDGDKDNNRWANLRDVPQKTNCENQRRPNSLNKTGFQGVFKRKGYKNFHAIIMVDNKQVFLGAFLTAEEANEVRMAAKRRLHEGCTI